jgi:uncharacterized membrane protein YhhN
MSVAGSPSGGAAPAAGANAFARRALPVIGLLAAVCSIVAITWAPPGLAWIHFAAKPAATICILLWALARPGDGTPVKRWIVIGLVASLCGDVALLWPQQGFLVGLVSFLVGHLAYLVAFTRPVRFLAVPAAFVAYALVAGGILSQLWAGVPAELRVPVVVYVVALAAMAAQAASVAWLRRGEADAARWRVAALGGALFVASDATLAADRFVGGVPVAGLCILATYWAAQWCLAGAASGGARLVR